MTMDFSAELSFDVIKKLSLFRACYEGLSWKFTPWLDEYIERCWKEIHSEHDDVRTYIGEFLSFSDKIKVCENDISGFYNLTIISGHLVRQYLQLQSSSKNAASFLQNTTSWACAAHITKLGYHSWSRTSNCGVKSVYLASGPSNRSMTE